MSAFFLNLFSCSTRENTSELVSLAATNGSVFCRSWVSLLSRNHSPTRGRVASLSRLTYISGFLKRHWGRTLQIWSQLKVTTGYKMAEYVSTHRYLLSKARANIYTLLDSSHRDKSNEVQHDHVMLWWKWPDLDLGQGYIVTWYGHIVYQSTPHDKHNASKIRALSQFSNDLLAKQSLYAPVTWHDLWAVRWSKTNFIVKIAVRIHT